jgi:DNA invertase Pin-like site-specific DNA recombinase
MSRAHKRGEVMDLSHSRPSANLGENEDVDAGRVSDEEEPSKKPRGFRSGENHGSHILTQDQVDEIRRIYAGGGVTQLELAEKFNTTNSNINAIIHNARWVDGDYIPPDTQNPVYHVKKLDMERARQIRELYLKGVHAGELARRFEVHISSIANVVQNKSWPDPTYSYKPRIVSERHSILTAEKVREIRDKLLKGSTSTSVAREYGVSKQAIDSIRSGRTWKHI